MAQSNRQVAGCVAAAVFVALTGCWQRPNDWPALLADLHQRYPSVRRISTADLAKWLEDPARPQPLLLDVRAADEFAVSHLPGARRVEPGGDVRKTVTGVENNAPIVTYCSVGYRSSAYAERLREAGFNNVQELDGSIFKWANEGRPVVRDEKRVNEVHPYDTSWGKFLDPALHAPVPGGKGADFRGE